VLGRSPLTSRTFSANPDDPHEVVISFAFGKAGSAVRPM
jgi:hypothetical protein